MNNIIGSRLRELRGTLPQSEMALKLNTKQTTYSAWERGERELDFATIVSVANLFHISLDWLFGLSEVRLRERRRVPAQSVSESSSEEYGIPYCRGCALRDARIDKLLDVLHRGSCPVDAPLQPSIRL